MIPRYQRPITVHDSSNISNNNSGSSSSSSSNNNSSSSSQNKVLFVGIALILLQVIVLIVTFSLQNNNDEIQHHEHPMSPIRVVKDSQIQKQIHQKEQEKLLETNHKILMQQEQQQQSHDNRNNHRQTPDGTFNGIPIYYHKEQLISGSQAHCIGESYRKKESWMYRSCHYELFCFDVQQQDFVIFQNPLEHSLVQKVLKIRPLMDVSQSYIENNVTVSLGGINRKWTQEGVPRLEWSPRIIPMTERSFLLHSFYTLPPEIVLIPFHSLSAMNPGHLVWDDWLPIYSLMEMFQLEDSTHYQPLPIRQVLPGPGLWASCDFTPEKVKACAKMHSKFWPLMTNNSNEVLMTTQLDISFYTNVKKEVSLSPTSINSTFVCAKHGLAGIGDLTDHGTVKAHGWKPADYTMTHNLGRSGQFWRFRNYALKNLGMDTEFNSNNDNNNNNNNNKMKIVFSLQSSDNPNRNLEFTKQIKLLRHFLNESQVTIETHVFKDESVQEQIKVVKDTTIFVTGSGGGAVTATFLPRGASCLIYYFATGGQDGNVQNYKPARLDWDLFNNIGYIRVHWLPVETMQSSDDVSAFIKLVKHELDTFLQMNSINGEVGQ